MIKGGNPMKYSVGSILLCEGKQWILMGYEENKQGQLLAILEDEDDVMIKAPEDECKLIFSSSSLSKNTFTF